MALIDFVHHTSPPFWRKLQGDDDYSISFILGDVKDGCANRSLAIFDAAGFMKLNLKTGKDIFDGAAFIKAMVSKYPHTEGLIDVERFGNDKDFWILIGMNGRGEKNPSIKEQVKEAKRIAKGKSKQ